jgi:16S rRNA (guanine966-N2)-methyltransferase
MAQRKSKPSRPHRASSPDDTATPPRIIGGQFRGRRLFYSGDLRTRPMKDRVREALFNLLGPDVRDTHAVDLFAGTGALGLEALSRGAAQATFIEQHFPTAEILKQNIALLEVTQVCRVVTGNTFAWFRGRPQLGPQRWTIFSSPPYDFYVSRAEEMLALITGLMSSAPPGSLFAVEADERFDFALLPDPEQWDVRRYPPAVVGIWEKGGSGE